MNDHVRSTLSLAIAGITVDVSLQISTAFEAPELLESLQERYAPFLSDSAGELTVQVQITDLVPAPTILDQPPGFQDGIATFDLPGYHGWIRPELGEGQLEMRLPYPIEGLDYFLRVVYALLAFRAGGLLFHAAGIVHKGSAYLFFGHSGSGKTTVARLSSEPSLASNKKILNDDLVMIMPAQKKGWQVFGTPFWNPTQSPAANENAPLAALLHLVQSNDVQLCTISPGQALAEVIANVPVLPANPEIVPQVLLRCQKLAANTPLFQLHFRPEPSFWDVIDRTLGNH